MSGLKIPWAGNLRVVIGSSIGEEKVIGHFDSIATLGRKGCHPVYSKILSANAFLNLA